MPTPKPRRSSPSLVFLAILCFAFAAAGCGFQRVEAAQPKPDPLKTVLRQMDEASSKFQSAQADLRQELFTKAVHDTETQAGQIYVVRKGGSTEMGVRLLPPDAKPGAAPAQIVEFKDNKARVFNPGTGQVDEFTASGKNQALAQTLMTLGFGGSGSDLSKAWTVTDQGPEQMSDGSKTVNVEKLDLKPKDAGIAKNFSHITIWIDPARGVSLKQVSFEASGGTPTGDTRTVYYTNIRLNQTVDVVPFAIKCKGKCTVVSH
jgi:outer membrane lipoprotein-sorting protein